MLKKVFGCKKKDKYSGLEENAIVEGQLIGS